jgi:glycolate oxidase iron-sulfur subunit
MSHADVHPGFRVADPAKLTQCVHCGLCLDACPTYQELGTEADSPRGRIHLIRALEEGTLALDTDVVRHLDLCLGCRACETACPSGVPYGQIIEEARAFVESTHARPWWDVWRRRALAAVFPNPKRLRMLLAPVRVLQHLHLWQIVARFVPLARLIPTLSPPRSLPETTECAGTEQGRVAFLSGCVMSEVFAETNEATVRILARNGFRVIVPSRQRCCGALHLHGGLPEEAKTLARNNLDAFPDDVDAIIVNAAGCGAALKGYGDLLAHDPRYAERAAAFSARVRDVTQFLGDLSSTAPMGSLAGRVTYHDACHLAHGQQIRAQPRALLRQIPGLELVELAEADVCCGSAGSYNLVEPEMSRRLLERKVTHIVNTGATCVVAANPGCVMQIQAGLRRRGLSIRVAHPVDLLHEAYDAAVPPSP